MSYLERRRFLWIIFFFALALAAAVANATTLAHLSLEQLSQASSAVARLRCVSSASLWDGGEIWTETHFEVVERAKGSIGEAVTVRALGGHANGFVSRVDGVPTFRGGEEVYLFLWGKPGEAYRVLGWSLGTFRIVRDARSGAETVTQESAATSLNPRTREFQSEGIRGMPVTEFREKLRHALEERVP